MRVFTMLVATALPLLVYTNCAEHHDALDASSITDNSGLVLTSLRTDATNLLGNQCSSCHNENTTDNRLKDLSSATALAGAGFVVLGSPQTSSLYIKLIDASAKADNNHIIQETDIHTLRDWIAAEGGVFDTYLGGTGSTPGGSSSPATFTEVRAILAQNCTSCHGAGGRPPNLAVDAATLRGASFQGKRLVIPNNPTDSLLLDSFSRMAPNQPLGVNSAAGNTVRSWINGGAL